MKVNFKDKHKEVNVDADVEGIIDKIIDVKNPKDNERFKLTREEKRKDKKLQHEQRMELINAVKRPEKKTRYQIKQEEQRKNEELKHKQKMQTLYISLGIFAGILLLCVIMSVLD